MQTAEQRRYWALRRKNEQQRQADARKAASKPQKIALVASDINEYRKMQCDFPDKEIHFDTSGQEQLELFSTYEFKKNRVRRDT